MTSHVLLTICNIPKRIMTYGWQGWMERSAKAKELLPIFSRRLLCYCLGRAGSRNPTWKSRHNKDHCWEDQPIDIQNRWYSKGNDGKGTEVAKSFKCQYLWSCCHRGWLQTWVSFYVFTNKAEASLERYNTSFGSELQTEVIRLLNGALFCHVHISVFLWNSELDGIAFKGPNVYKYTIVVT